MKSFSSSKNSLILGVVLSLFLSVFALAIPASADELSDAKTLLSSDQSKFDE